MKTKFQKICTGTVLVLSGLFVWFLLEQSLFATARLSRSGVMLFTADNPFVHGVVFAALALLAMVLTKQKNKSSHIQKLLPIIFLAGYCLCLAAYVYLTQLATKADSWYMLDSAKKLLEGDTSSLQPGGYIARYQNQKGLLLYVLLGLHVFGTEGTLGFQLLNVVWIGLSVALLVQMYRLLAGGSGLPVLLAVLAFVPLGLYVTFVYGNLPGLALALAGMTALVRYLQSGRWQWAAGMAVALALAVQIKSNYSIALVACLIVLVLQGFFDKKYKLFAAVLALILCTALAGRATDALLYTRYGVPKTEGTPATVWVAMGLQHTPGSTPGFYNGYINSAYDGTEQTTAQGKVNAMESIRASLSEYLANPAEGLRFFSQKNSAQWNETTFHSLDTNRGRTTENGKRLPGPILSLLHEGGALYTAVFAYCSLYATQLWLGVLLCFVLGRRHFTLPRLLPAIIFLGGALFHTVWEGNCEYTWPYVVLLIPYGVQGFVLLGRALNRLRALPAAERKAALCKSVPLRCFGVVLLSFVCTGLSGWHFSAGSAELARDTAQRAQDTQSAQPVLAEGVYTVKTEQGWLCAADTEDGTPVTLTTDPAQALRLHIYDSRYSMTADIDYYMLTTEQLPTVSLGASDSEGAPALIIRGRWVDEKDKRQQWKLTQTEGGWRLTNENGQSGAEDDLPLSCDHSGQVQLGGSGAIWQLEPAK